MNWLELNMAFFTAIFSPETYRAFERSARNVIGFCESEKTTAAKIKPGDVLVCYMAKLCRWIGLLEAVSNSFVDSTPLFSTGSDPLAMRFQVRTIVWLPKEKAVPIHDLGVWNALSFTQDSPQDSGEWTEMRDGSLRELSDFDGLFLEDLLCSQF